MNEARMIQQKKFKTLIMNWEDHNAWEIFSIRQTLFVLQYISNVKVEIFHVLQDKVSPPTRRCAERGAKNRQEMIFKKVWTRYEQNFDKFLMTQKNLRLGFLFTDFSQHFGIYLLAFALKFLFQL